MTSAFVMPVSLGELMIGCTVLLGLGTLAAILTAAPVHRQRAAELSVSATVLWLVLALIPMPRWRPSERMPQSAVTVERQEGAALAHVGAGSARDADDEALRASPDPIGPTVTSSMKRGDEKHPGDRRQSSSLLRVLIASFAIGSAAVAAYVLLGLALIRILLDRSIPPPPWLEMLFAERAHVLGVRRCRLRLTSAQLRPLSAGIFTPTVVLPRVMADPAREADLCRIIDHELVHVQRGDVLSRALFAAAATVLWPHPLFWWLRARASLAAELIADDAAARSTSRRAYARSLLALSEELQSLRPVPGIVPGTFRNRSELTRRIEMLASKHKRLAMSCSPTGRAIHVAVTFLAVAACAAVFGTRSLPAQESRLGSTIVDQVITRETISAEPVRTTAAASAERNPADAAPMAGREPVARTEPAKIAAQDQGAQPTTRQQDPDPAYAAVLALVERVLTIRSELEMARADLAENDRRSAVGTVSDAFLRQLKFNVDALQLRLNAVMILVESEIQATQLELALVQEQHKRRPQDPEGMVRNPEARIYEVRLAGRLKVLQSLQ
jgi:beta-lactamase regulating signal transducer with metallopeptidase domain